MQLVIAKIFPYKIFSRKYSLGLNVLMILLIGSLISFGIKDLIVKYKTIFQNTKINSQSPENPYVKLLAQIRDMHKFHLKSNKDLRSVVYIPKSEVEYWQSRNDYECLRSSYSIPAYSGLSAIYGLISNENCGSRFYGLKDYSEKDFLESNHWKYSNAEVCKKILSMNYNSFYKIEEKKLQFIQCTF